MADLIVEWLSTFWSIPGMTIDLVKPDWMHCVCLGILQYLSGNCLYELFRELGGTFKKADAACTKLLNLIVATAHELKLEVPFRALTIRMIRASSSDKPKLKLKAAEGRRFLPILVGMLDKFFDSAHGHACLRLQCTQALASCYEELGNWQDGESMLRLGVFARRHITLYRELQQTTEDPFAWQVFPTHHLFIHLAESCTSNPAKNWNYGDESEIRLAVKMCRSVHATHVYRMLLRRYCLTAPFL